MAVRQAIDEAARNGKTCDIMDLKRLLENVGFVRVYGFNCDGREGIM